ncbi:MAG: hypothetical protein Q8R60_19920 [Mycobacteriales bacterium]|nr:hypothetical protein [Mycobacteriales bacterium]
MRRLLLAALVVCSAFVVPGSSSGSSPGSSSAVYPTPGFASANVEWMGNLPIHADSAGARLLGDHLYITSSHELSIYDVKTDPLLPRLLSTLPIPNTPYFAEEDVDTNGKVLLVGTATALVVVDVRNKALPVVSAVLQGADEHTISCVLDCTWAYGSEGVIVDLRDPAAPKIAGDWTKALPAGVGQTHDVTEVSPGLVVTSTKTLWMLDARKDPSKPKVVASGASPDGRFIHANLWPRGGKDTMLLVGGETSGAGCSDPEGGAFMTWDATQVSGRTAKTKRFRLLDSYRVPEATLQQGGAAVTETYCSHWFTTRPGWKDGGDVAIGWYENGTRFVDVSPKGKITQTGYFTPAGTSASAAYWVSKDLLYVLDYQRGLDILRFSDTPVTRSVRPGAPGLKPWEAPATPRVFLPGLLNGTAWTCAAPVPAVA